MDQNALAGKYKEKKWQHERKNVKCTQIHSINSYKIVQGNSS